MPCPDGFSGYNQRMVVVERKRPGPQTSHAHRRTAHHLRALTARSKPLTTTSSKLAAATAGACSAGSGHCTSCGDPSHTRAPTPAATAQRP
eukprot:7040813-Prymnesium_polylepis.1